MVAGDAALAGVEQELMSLINRMLNDLEERQAQSSAVDAGILNGVSPAIKADRGSSALARILSWTPAAIGFLATVYAGYLYLDSHGVASLSSLQRVNTTAGFAAQPPKEDDVASGPAVGTGLDSGEPPVTGLDGVLTLRLSNAVVGMQGRPRAVSKENAEDRSMPAPILYGPGRPSAQRADSSDLEELSRAIRAPSPASAEMRLTLNAPRSGPAAGHVPATPEAVPEVRKTPVPMAPETKAEADYRAGLAHLRLGELVAGEDRLRQALAVNPEHIKAREVLAAHLVRQQRLERAGYLLADGLQRVPEASNLAKLYARILVEQGQLDDAVEVLARASPPV